MLGVLRPARWSKALGGCMSKRNHACYLQISQLVEDVQRLQGTVSKLKDTGSSQVAKLEEELSTKSRSLQLLEERLQSQEDYDEVKRELKYVFRVNAVFDFVQRLEILNQ